MTNRWYLLAVLACWVASMGWLLVEKILPTMNGGDQPDFSAVLPAADEPPRPVCWEIQYRGRDIGSASSEAVRQDDNSGRAESDVHFHGLPLSEIISELLGTVGALVKPLWSGDEEITVDMTIHSEMEIAAGGKLESFVTSVRLGELEDVVEVRGQVRGGKLRVEVYSPTSNEDQRQMQLRYRDEIDLPSDALASGALSPQPRLANLHVGQTWTFPVYRPFPPNSPVQMVQARVEREDLFTWNGQPERVFHVVYRDDAGSGITIAREPIGRLWVRPDGTVLQQEARLANLYFRFIRRPDDACDL